MKTKSMAYNRDVSFRKAIHRRRISRYWCWRPSYGDYYNNLHQYSKNKIHCSCPDCSPKTRNKGKRKSSWNKAINWKISDLRKIEKLEFELKELI